MSRITSTWVAAAIACAPWPALAAPLPKVRLEVDTSALPESSATNLFAQWLAQDQTRTILDGGLEVSPTAPITIRLSVRRYGEQGENYETRVALLDVDQQTMFEERVIRCELCTDGQLIGKVSPEVARLAARVLYTPVGEEAAPEPEPEPEVPQQAPEAEESPAVPVSEPAPSRQTWRKRIGALGAWGIASAATGLGATGAGIGLALAPDQTRAVQDHVELRSTRPSGIVLASVGAALMVTGAVLVAIDVRRQRRANHVSVLPGFSKSSAFVSLSMRF